MKYFKIILVIMFFTYSISFAKDITIEVVPSGPAGIRGEGADIQQDKKYELNSDIIVLKNGDTIEGNIISYSNRVYRIKIGGFIKPVNETTIKTINNEYINDKRNNKELNHKRLTVKVMHSKNYTTKEIWGNTFATYYGMNNNNEHIYKKITITDKGIIEKKIEDYEKNSICSSKRYNFIFGDNCHCSIFWAFWENMWSRKNPAIYDLQKDKYYYILPNNSKYINDRIVIIPLALKDNKLYACLLEYEVKGQDRSDYIKTNKSHTYDVYCFDYTQSMLPTGPVATCKVDRDIALKYDTNSWWKSFFDEQVGLFKFFNNDKKNRDKEFFKVYNVEIDKAGNFEIKFNKKLKVDFSESLDKGEMKYASLTTGEGRGGKYIDYN